MHGREVTAFCSVFAKRLFPYLLSMLSAHLRLTGALGYVLDLAHPTQLKRRECFSLVIPEWRMITASLSAACSRR